MRSACVSFFTGYSVWKGPQCWSWLPRSIPSQVLEIFVDRDSAASVHPVRFDHPHRRGGKKGAFLCSGGIFCFVFNFCLLTPIQLLLRRVWLLHLHLHPFCTQRKSPWAFSFPGQTTLTHPADKVLPSAMQGTVGELRCKCVLLACSQTCLPEPRGPPWQSCFPPGWPLGGVGAWDYSP